MALNATALRAAPHPDRWEYCSLRMTSLPLENIAALNELGADGWELVQVLSLHYVLKRRMA
jgi:hypothetical protein